MLRNERLDLGQYGFVCHGQDISRVITRMSMLDAGNYTILRDFTRAPIPWSMAQAPEIDLDRLKADMADAVERTSARKFSLKATGGKNPDFYRNFANNGQDKRMSANVYLGIVNALGKNPLEYATGVDAATSLPNATALTTAFAILLDSVGINPFEDERAQKLAAQFPGVLQSIATLRERGSGDQSRLPGEVPLADAGDQPEA